MDAKKEFTGSKNIAVARGCFDLPYAQAIDLCGTCHGEGYYFTNAGDPAASGEKLKCPDCDGLGLVQARMITCWKFTEEEFQYMVDNPEARAVHLSIIGVQHPRTLVTVLNPLDMWDDVIEADSPEAVELLKRAVPDAG